MDATGLMTRTAGHGACVVGEGVKKYAINNWVYNKPRTSGEATWDNWHPRLSDIRRGRFFAGRVVVEGLVEAFFGFCGVCRGLLGRGMLGRGRFVHRGSRGVRPSGLAVP